MNRAYRHVDESRLWNDLTSIEVIAPGESNPQLGKEWRYAFQTVEKLNLCVASKGIPNMDIHLLWRHNRRLRDIYRNTEMSAPPPLVVDGGVKKLYESGIRDSVLVGIRNGILFIAPQNGEFDYLDEAYNLAGLYAKNGEIAKAFGETSKAFLLSQHFKEVIVVIANVNGVYFKAYKTSRLALFQTGSNPFCCQHPLACRWFYFQ
ncbi:unnamed protein product [Anisakis simplex]|uniref:CN hydrolase domain-containing protein n=1 Tax=Anisakis simplex TaxID=6269 RepID=A0A0M3J6J2_ANISI|nr:unnamed protein product [Anisakis simplex]